MADDFRGKTIKRKHKPPREPCLTSVSASMTEHFRYLILPKELKVRRGKTLKYKSNKQKPKMRNKSKNRNRRLEIERIDRL